MEGRKKERKKERKKGRKRERKESSMTDPKGEDLEFV